MKNLFVTFDTKTKKKQVRQNIFLCYERKNEKTDNFENSSLINSLENSTNNTLNTSSSSTINSSIDSGKVIYNSFYPEQQFSFNQNFMVNSDFNTNNLNKSNYNQFLGKKTKIHFDIIKNEEAKSYNSNNNNNFNLFYISNSQSTESSLINKDVYKNESSELNQEKKEKYNFNDSPNITIKKIAINDNNYLNEGRWSFNEHIKFIEAIAEYGKNWKNVQKYVGSRTSAQARSHAQKFFLKLKTIKNTKYNFDFSSNNIKNLSDIIEIIKKKEDYYLMGKDYIINTLINLSKTINCENLDLDKDIKKLVLNTNNNKNKEKENENKKDDDFTFGNINEKNYDAFNDLNNINTKKEINILNESKEIIDEKNIISQNNTNKIQIKDNINNIINEGKQSFNIKIINSKNINEIKDDIINDKLINKDYIKKGKEKLLINNNIMSYNKNESKIINDNLKDNYLRLEEKNKNYFFDDGIIYVTDNLEFFDMNNISFKIKEYYYLKTYEIPFIYYNKYFYS